MTTPSNSPYTPDLRGFIEFLEKEHPEHVVRISRELLGKYVFTHMPGAEITGVRGGIHNSVTRIVLKPTHMIGGYAQLSYGFNYYGTIGTNRDEFVVVRKMSKIDWLDTPVAAEKIAVVQAQGESP